MKGIYMYIERERRRYRVRKTVRVGLRLKNKEAMYLFFRTPGYLPCRVLCPGPVVVCPLFILVKQSSDALHSAQSYLPEAGGRQAGRQAECSCSTQLSARMWHKPIDPNLNQCTNSCKLLATSNALCRIECEVPMRVRLSDLGVGSMDTLTPGLTRWTSYIRTHGLAATRLSLSECLSDCR